MIWSHGKEGVFLSVSIGRLRLVAYTAHHAGIRSEDIECEELARGHAVMHNGIAVRELNNLARLHGVTVMYLVFS